MNSQKLVKRIIQLINEDKTLKQQKQEIIYRKQEDDDLSWIQDDDGYIVETGVAILDISSFLLELQRNALKDNFFYFDCPLQVYREHFDGRFEEYQERNIDADISDFIKDELEEMFSPYDYRTLNTNLFDSVNYSFYVQNLKSYQISLEKKQQFLIQKLEEHGWTAKIYRRDSSMYEMEGPIFYPEAIAFEKTPLSDFQNVPLNDNTSKISWAGGPAQLGYIFRNLVDEGYINPPENKDGEVNCSAFARQLIEHFDLETSPASLAKYISTDNSKFEEASRNFKKADFNLPDIRIVT